MANFSKFLKILGLTKEGTRGTVETSASVYHAIDPDSEINYKLNHLDDVTVRGEMAERAPKEGTKDGDGVFKFPVRAQNFGEWLQMLIGNPSSAESSNFLVTLSSNDKIDFTEDGGGEVSATLTPGSYPMGSSSAVVGSLCALIKTQMEISNGTAATYTVAYSYTTKKITITKNSGVFVLKWSTGTNTATSAKTLLGFTNADTSSAIAATSDSTTSQFSYVHTFTPGNTLLLPTYTFFMERSLNVLKYNYGSVHTLKITCNPDSFIKAECGVFVKSEASGSIGSPSFSAESEELTFQHVTFKIAGSQNTEVKSWTLELKNGQFKKRTFSNSQDLSDVIATKNQASGTFMIYFANATERDKFIANTETSVEIVATGDLILNGVYYTVEFLFDSVYYTAFPYGEMDDLLAAAVTWKAAYNTSNSRIYRARITNKYTAY